ncbi:MAG: benzoyl-CoA reductase subunit A, partial [Rhodospirillales bacterium]|nr:benzoyl-CoA reductase subunit A [Rhodospirillales bacterium]
MKCYIGIDLGSTTTKAVLMDADMEVLGQGITNSRSNYETAAAVAKQEAHIGARLTLFRRGLGDAVAGKNVDELMEDLELNIRLEQFLEQLEDLRATCAGHIRDGQQGVLEALTEVFDRITAEAPDMFRRGARRRSDFFR